MKCSFEHNSVFIDGIQTQILSGAIHYFRTFPEQWRDRLLKLKQCGFNTVETYLAWHLHEEREGQFNFQGHRDFVRFIQIAEELGLMVILRPGPYICSECDLGGLPGWLLGKPGLRLRCDNPVFLKYVQNYFSHILKLINPLQCTHGGPVIAMQVENEYGSYAADKNYLAKLCIFIRECGIDIQLFTSDGDIPLCLEGGTLSDLPVTINFRNLPQKHFQNLERWNHESINPHFAMELWVGKAWHWGEIPLHHSEDAVAEDIRAILKQNENVNCYMFHGGTNFGFTSGANFIGNTYKPLLTSYEVDSPLDESGKPTPKYEAIRKALKESYPGTLPPVPPSHNDQTVPAPFQLTEYAALCDSLDILSTAEKLPLPETMEYFGQSFGYILYSTELMKYHSGIWSMRNMRDRAVILLDRKIIANIYRNDRDQVVNLIVPEDRMRLDILIENMGRVNFGTEMEYERKGMTGFETGGNRHLTDWTIRCLPLSDISSLKFGPCHGPSTEPGFFHGTFEAEYSRDLFLKNPCGTRGCVWVNGFNIGRYWNIGPQHTLYIPAPLVKSGKNELVVFDTNGLYHTSLSFSSERLIGPMSNMILEKE